MGLTVAETRAFCAYVWAERPLQICSRKGHQDERKRNSREFEHSEISRYILGSRNAAGILAGLGIIVFGECPLLVYVGGGTADSIFGRYFPVANSGSEWAAFSYTMRYVTVLKMIAMGAGMAPQTILVLAILTSCENVKHLR